MRDSNQSDDRTRRDYVSLFIVLTLTISVSGYFWSEHIIAEMARLPPLMALATWIFEIFGLLSAVWFVAFYCVLGSPLPEAASVRGTIFLVMLAWCADCLMTGYVAYDEYRAFERSQVAQAQVVQIGRGVIGGGVRYAIRYEFVDQAGNKYIGNAWLSAIPGVALHAALPPPLGAKLGRMQVPMPLAIRIDPNYPQRSWIDGMGWNREDGIGPMFFYGLLAQAAFLLPATFLTANAAAVSEIRIYYRFAPMGIVAVWFAAMGIIRSLHASSFEQWVP